MAGDDWPDPNPTFTSLEDLERAMDARFNEVLRDIQEFRIEVEEQRWWRWGCLTLLCWIAWKVS